MNKMNKKGIYKNCRYEIKTVNGKTIMYWLEPIKNQINELFMEENSDIHKKLR
jgi:hypothetical protein